MIAAKNHGVVKPCHPPEFVDSVTAGSTNYHGAESLTSSSRNITNYIQNLTTHCHNLPNSLNTT